MKVSGIYKIQSISHPERCYIGSAVNIKERWRLHLVLLKNQKHHSYKLQRHFNKYGEQDLQFSIFLECSKEDLIKNEQKFLDELNPWFNIAKIAGNSLGIKRTQEYCQSLIGNKRGCGNKGKKLSPFSEERKQKLRGRIPWNKGKIGVYSQETIKSISNSLKGNIPWNKGKIDSCSGGNKKPIFQYDLQGNFIKEWNSAIDVERNLFIGSTGINKCLQNKCKTAYGFIWRYKNEKQIA